jgi:hypothetical protein
MVTSEHGERCSVITPRLEMDGRAPRDHHFCIRALRALDAEEVVPHLQMGVNPHDGLAQSHKGHDVQNPQGGQIMQLQVIILQQ